MGEPALQLHDTSRDEMLKSYLNVDGGYWINNDVWRMRDLQVINSSFYRISKTVTPNGVLLDFTSLKNKRIKLQIKYYCLYSLKESRLGITYVYCRLKPRIYQLGEICNTNGLEMITEDVVKLKDLYKSDDDKRLWKACIGEMIKFFRDYYDEREELDRDIWYALKIPGVKLSAAVKRTKPSMSFEEIPLYYRESVKRYMKTLIYRRSWSFCTEILMYIRYFYKSFYEHGYFDGFLENLSRSDIEKYLQWVAEDYESNNATFRSKAVSFIRNWLDFIQLAEFKEAPKKDVTRLIFDEDIPKRERASDTFEKIKYIPEPVRIALDSAIDDIEPAEMKPVYILLRETGWRGTDILNLRYDECLDYVWNSHDEEYVPYLYDEITKTGIPLHKIPIRPEVAQMVSKLIEEAKAKSTDENNPDKYLFNTYDGKSIGLPYSKAAFAKAVNELIARKEIKDGSGELYHFKTHSLRHTRAMEYTEQGMPIGIIQQILGHCSLQMTLHYSKVSEDMLYKKWQETEKLDLFKPSVAPPNKSYQHTEEIHYEHVRKNLDAVRVPFGTCFKPTKIGCKNQTQMCLDCTNFCSTKADIPAYEAEIKRVEALISIATKTERPDWEEKNRQYLSNLVKMRNKILQEGIVHKNGNLREEADG